MTTIREMEISSPLDSDGLLDISPKDLFLEIAKGSVTGHSQINKFGFAEAVNTGSHQVIWDGLSDVAGYPDADYTWPSDTAATFYVASSDNGDTQVYEVQGLDANFVAQTVEVTAAGNTVTALSGTWTRVFRIKNKGATDNAGRVYVTNADDHTAGVPDVDANIKAMVSVANNQTLMALYTVPAACTAYLTSVYASCGKGEDFITTLWARPFGGVFQLKDYQYLYQQSWSHPFGPYPSFAAKTDIVLKARAVTTTNKPISGGFDMILVAD